MIGYLALGAFAATIPAANWLIGHVGVQVEPHGPHLIPVGIGLMAPSGVLMVGLAFTLRDIVQRELGMWWAVGAIVTGAALSGFLAPGPLVIASAAAFLLAEMADLAVYTPLQRKGLMASVTASNAVGAVIDSAVFLVIAFGSLDFIGGQIVGKLWMTALALPVVWWMRQRRAAP